MKIISILMMMMMMMIITILITCHQSTGSGEGAPGLRRFSCREGWAKVPRVGMLEGFFVFFKRLFSNSQSQRSQSGRQTQPV